MSRKHMVGSVGVANKMQYLRRLLPNDSKHNEASFSTISTDKLSLTKGVHASCIMRYWTHFSIGINWVIVGQ